MHEDCLVVHQPDVVVHKAVDGKDLVVHTRHGKYKDLEARKAYRRDWMRDRRARKP